MHPRTRIVLLAAVAAASACSSKSPSTADGCAALFGSPTASTGLTTAQCSPRCDCAGNVFAPPSYDAEFLRALVQDWTHADPYPPLTADPYASPAPADDPPGTVCGVLPAGSAGTIPRPYHLVTYASEAEARGAGARPTHFGHCGVCSTLENLAVYVRENDLSEPVKTCGLMNPTHDGDVACLQALGFDLPCAQIWAYNTAHTRSACLSPCLAAMSQPYNLPDGSLNPCLQCDETQSGPVFKGTAGRTRRNSGLPNAICRPCSEVQPLVHAY